MLCKKLNIKGLARTLLVTKRSASHFNFRIVAPQVRVGHSGEWLIVKAHDNVEVLAFVAAKVLLLALLPFAS